MTLYADLGVDPDASGDELRKAHRKAVNRTHPDKGGNREDFEKVQHAYLILRDPKTRQRYDETGEHDAQPDNELAEIGTILVGAFDQAMTESSGRFAVSDLIASTRVLLARRKADAANQRKILDEAIQNFTKVRDRLSFKGGGADILVSSLNAKIAEGKRMQAAFSGEIEKIERAEAYAADYGYRFDPSPMSAGSYFQKSLQDELFQMMRNAAAKPFP